MTGKGNGVSLGGMITENLVKETLIKKGGIVKQAQIDSSANKKNVGRARIPQKYSR